MEPNNIITIAGGLFSVGFIYATLKGQIDTLKNEVKDLRTTHNRIIAVESKLDILINHFIK